MKEEYAIYSEEEYISKLYLYNHYSSLAVDCIWEEIQTYRRRFRYVLQFTHRSYYVTMNHTLFYKILRIYDADKETKKISAEHVYEKNQKQKLLLFTMRNKISISPLLLSFLFEEELELIKLFVLCMSEVKEKILTYYLFLIGKTHWETFLHEWKTPVFEKIDPMDLTYAFRYFLDDLYLHIKDETIPHLQNREQQEQTLEELILCYPMLNQKTLTFYCAHKSNAHYYTIQHYRDFTKVSYESARKAMDDLVALGFYEKTKIGKKFVYSVR